MAASMTTRTAARAVPRQLSRLSSSISPCTRTAAQLSTCSHSYNASRTSPPSPTTLPPQRPLQRSSTLEPQRPRPYYTASSPDDPPYAPFEAAILGAATLHIPTHGFTHKTLALGAHDAGYLAATTNLFPRGAFELVLHHLATQRLALKDTVQFPAPTADDAARGRRPPGVTQKIATLLLARLRANEAVLGQLPQALGLMSLAGNIPASVRELGLLVDEMWYLAGDVSVDSSWYTKRGLLAGVYASSEVFMLQDRSEGFKETEAFVGRRLEDVAAVGRGAGSVGEWLGFTGAASVNVLRSWGVRI